MLFFGAALLASACIPWNQIADDTPPEKAVQVCAGEVARMLRFSYWKIDEQRLPYRALLVVRSDNTVAVRTSTHRNQMTLNVAQKDDLREAIASFPEFYKLLVKKPFKPAKLPSEDGGIDFYFEMRRGPRTYRFSNTRYDFEQGYGGVPLFSALEVYQYLLQPVPKEPAAPPDAGPS